MSTTHPGSPCAASKAGAACTQSVVDAAATDTELIDDFSVLWPNGPEPHPCCDARIDRVEPAADLVGRLAAGAEELLRRW
jgi:hypothetical protein